MTETRLAVSALPTPLTSLLNSAVRPPRTAEYRGVVTPQELDAPTGETAALATSAAAHDLGWMRRVAVRGEDRFRWLSGMVTNTVSDIASGFGAWSMVLNAQGRIQGDLTVWRDGDDVTLEIAADQYDRLLAHFDKFIIMDDVELVPHDSTGETAVGLTGPQASEVLKRMGLPTLPEAMTSLRLEWNGLDLQILRGYGTVAEHYELWTPIAGLTRVWRTLSTAGASAAGSAALEAFRIAEGIPAYGSDIVERDLPQETSQTRGLNFNKGCYLGQEIVERIRSRGNVHRHLRQLEVDGPLPEPGAELLLNGNASGQVRSVAELTLPAGSRKFALGMIRSEAELSDKLFTYSVGTESGTAHLMTASPKL